MRKLLLLTLLWPLLLQGCATAPRVILQAVCPSIPPLDQPPAQQEPTFSDRMGNFLSGKVPEPIGYDYSLSSAKPDTLPPAKP